MTTEAEQLMVKPGRRWRVRARQADPAWKERQEREAARREARKAVRGAEREEKKRAKQRRRDLERKQGKKGEGTGKPAKSPHQGSRLPAKLVPLPPYDAAAWSELVNICRQPRSAYRFALLLPGVKLVRGELPAGLPPAGEYGRWLVLPGAALLLRREAGDLAGMVDLEAVPVIVGPFVLRRMAPVTPEQAEKREKLRAERAARRERRGTPVPNIPAIPNEGRAMRFGSRLVLSVAGDYVKARRREAGDVARRATWGTAREQATKVKARPAREGKAARPAQPGKALPEKVHQFDPMFLANSLNRMTAELESVAEFAWVEVTQLRAWDATARGEMVKALTRTGMKHREATEWAARHVRPWQRSRPAQSKKLQEGRE